MGQMSSLLTERQHGSFPRNSEANQEKRGKSTTRLSLLGVGESWKYHDNNQWYEKRKLKNKIKSARKIKCKGSGPKR